MSGLAIPCQGLLPLDLVLSWAGLPQPSALIIPLVAAAGGGGGGHKVAVLGAAGGIGQPLGLLLKLNPLVAELSLYDIAGTPGVAADISHVNTRAKVRSPLGGGGGEEGGGVDPHRLERAAVRCLQTRGFAGDAQLAEALAGADLVVIPAGVPRKPGMTRDDLFNTNASIVQSLAEAIAKHCPKAIAWASLTGGSRAPQALVNMISNPVNSTVPIAAEVFKRAGTYDAKRLFGVTTLDVVRAKTFYAEKKGLNVADVSVPVVGGHAGITILPLFSQASPHAALSDEEVEQLTKRTQDGGTEVVAAKAGKGSATLSMAYAGALFANSCLKGLNGETVTEYAYVQSSVTEAPFFASKVSLGSSGVEEVHGLGELSDYEKEALKKVLPELKDSIEKGVKFVTG
eukprot:SM000031S11530  [mRNA]  locus=s31:139894:142335:- [translate_table: standard]